MHDIVWDAEKARSNVAKHGILFSDAATVLDDPGAITVEDTRYQEQRWITVGMDLLGRVCVVVYTYPDTAHVRLISARPATRREREQYEKS